MRRPAVWLLACALVALAGGAALAAPSSADVDAGDGDYLRFAVNVEKIKGHLAALVASAEAGAPADEHVESAIRLRYPRFAGSLRERDRALQERLAAELKELAELVERRASLAQLRAVAGSVAALADRAIAVLIPAVVRDSLEFQGQVIWALLTEVADEFEEAQGEEPEGGEAARESEEESEEEEEEGPRAIRVLGDYQEAWGYLQRVQALWQQAEPRVRSRTPEAAEGVREGLGLFQRMIPSFEPPEVVGDPEELEGALDDLLYWLAEGTGAALSAGADPAEALPQTERLVLRARSAYRQGKLALALELAHAAYDAYGGASGPLGFLMPDLHGRIRSGLGGELRDAIRRRLPAEEVDQVVTDLLQALGKARQLLGIT